MAEKKKVKHHGFSHLVLFIGLFILTAVIFGDATAGPVTSGLNLLVFGFSMITSIMDGNLASAQRGPEFLQALVAFVINVVVLYIVSSIIILFFNIFFGSKKKS